MLGKGRAKPVPFVISKYSISQWEGTDVYITSAL